MLHTIRMGVAELYIPDPDDRHPDFKVLRRRLEPGQPEALNATIRNVFRAITPPPGSSPNEDQKNWAPFVYNSSMHYIQRVHPLHVVSVRHYDDDPYNELYAVSVSQEEYASVWRYGELRGGTNALLVPSGGRRWGASSVSDFVYVALFHSNTLIPGNILRTYFMGGMVFTAHPPFRVLAMTEFPIIDNSLYDGELTSVIVKLISVIFVFWYVGPWDALKNRHIDYVPFPSTIFLDGNVIHLSFGWQDNLGCTAKMRLEDLLDIMVPV